MKFVLNSLTDVAETLRGEYEEREGKFYLKLEGFESHPTFTDNNKKLAEFRDNNRTLNGKVQELETKLKGFEGINPTEHITLKTRIAELEAQGVKGTQDVAKLVTDAVKSAVTPLEEKLRIREESEKVAQAALAQQALEGQLREAGLRGGIDERAISDFINRGAKVYRLIDGRPAPRNGETPIFSKVKPAEELSMDEWTETLRAEAPFLFKPSKGGGAGGNRETGFSGQKQWISNDPIVFGENLEKIARGEVLITPS